MMVFFTTAWSQPEWMRGGDDEAHQPMFDGKQMFDRLNLKEEQRSQVEKLRSEMMKSQIAARAKIQTMRIDLKEQFRSEAPDRAAIEKMLGDIGTLQTDMKLHATAFWFGVYKILTPEQQKIWRQHALQFAEDPMRHPAFRRHMRMPHASPKHGEKEGEN